MNREAHLFSRTFWLCQDYDCATPKSNKAERPPEHPELAPSREKIFHLYHLLAERLWAL